MLRFKKGEDGRWHPLRYNEKQQEPAVTEKTSSENEQPEKAEQPEQEDTQQSEQPEETEQPEKAEQPDYSKMKDDELKARAEELEIDIEGKTRRQIINALKKK